jgi:DNA-binding NarL/FixJ family response regulator
MLRVVLVAGEPLFRLGFRSMLDASGDLSLVADAADARSGFRCIDAEHPDVVIIDVALAGMNGIAATREVKRRMPTAKVVLLAGWPCERDALDGLTAGAGAFVLKTEPPEALLYAIRAVAHGHTYITPQLRGQLFQVTEGARRGGSGDCTDVLRALSPREREVLDLVVKGLLNREIARELCVSIKTIDTHRTRINRKLGCTNAADVIRFAAENGLLRSSTASTASRSPPERTIVLFVDDDPELRGQLLGDVVAHGYHQMHAAAVNTAMAEMGEQQRPSCYVIDGGEPLATAELYHQLVGEATRGTAPVILAFAESAPGKPAVRLAASLPHAESCEQFVAALDRAVARRRSPGVEAEAAHQA